jgi:hypothetical protein
LTYPLAASKDVCGRSVRTVHLFENIDVPVAVNRTSRPSSGKRITEYPTMEDASSIVGNDPLSVSMRKKDPKVDSLEVCPVLLYAADVTWLSMLPYLRVSFS